MPLSAGPMTKPEARKWLVERGYHDEFAQGRCGDGPFGSRLYFRTGPHAVQNAAGWPCETATLSRLPDGWHATIFGGVYEGEPEGPLAAVRP